MTSQKTKPHTAAGRALLGNLRSVAPEIEKWPIERAILAIEAEAHGNGFRHRRRVIAAALLWWFLILIPVVIEVTR